MTKLKFVGGSPVEPKELARCCPCGWRDQFASRAKHAHEHLSWAMGVPVPASLDWPKGEAVAVIHGTSPLAWRRLAGHCAHIAQRDGGYDFSTFPASYGRGFDDEAHSRAYCYRVDQRQGAAVVGYLAVGDLPTAGRYGIGREHEVIRDDGLVRPTVMLVFAAYHWRQLGIGRALVEAAAQHAKTAVADLAWMTPFTDTGRALARSCADPDGWVWVA